MELSKTPYQKAARALPSCPPIFAKCARIASENFLWHQNLPSIASSIGRAEKSMLKERSNLCSARLLRGYIAVDYGVADLLPVNCKPRGRSLDGAPIDH